jgi:hypothetical protein
MGEARQCVRDNLTTTFASRYNVRVTLDEMLRKDAVTNNRAIR